MIVKSRTPLRISFGGGGTDIPYCYELLGGAVISSTITAYVDVMVSTKEDNIEDKENGWKLVDPHKNEIARECIKFAGLCENVKVYSATNIEGSSGLGASSSFTVGLLLALYSVKGSCIPATTLAEAAFHVEAVVLNRPIGKQDHYAASIGGLNRYNFNPDGSVDVIPVLMPQVCLNELFGSASLYSAGNQRCAANVLGGQKERGSRNAKTLLAMKRQVDAIEMALTNHFSLEAVGRHLSSNWEHKRTLSPDVSNADIDQAYKAAIEAGAHGAKLCGAGAGGFLLVIENPTYCSEIRNALRNRRRIDVGYEPRGASLWAG